MRALRFERGRSAVASAAEPVHLVSAVWGCGQYRISGATLKKYATAGRCGFPQQLLPADFRGHDRVLGNMVVTRRLSLMLTARGEEVLTYAQIWSELTRKLARHGNRDPYLRY